MSGLKYFPLDCYLDPKFEKIEQDFGLKGFAIVVKFYQRIYGDLGYYCEINEDVVSAFAEKNKVGTDTVSEILSCAIKKGIFNQKLYQTYGILTSRGIQLRFVSGVRAYRNAVFEMEKRYLLFNTQILQDERITNIRIVDNFNTKTEEADTIKEIKENNKQTTTKRQTADEKIGDNGFMLLRTDGRTNTAANAGAILLLLQVKT